LGAGVKKVGTVEVVVVGWVAGAVKKEEGVAVIGVVVVAVETAGTVTVLPVKARVLPSPRVWLQYVVNL
jgi:hypothetical protein